MQNQPSKNPTFHYRPYNLHKSLPAICFIGDNWVPTPVLDMMHFHNCMEIGLCHSGSGSIYAEGQRFPYRPGDICMIPANTPHMTVRDSVHSHWEYLAFDPALLFPASLWKQLGNTEVLCDYCPSFPYVFPQELNRKAAPLIQNIIEEFSSLRPSYEYTLKGLFICLCSEITRCQSALHTDKAVTSTLAIRPALHIIHQEYPQKLSCPQLAGACNLSETHFRRIFKTITSLSPLEYLNHFRIRKSCILLFDQEYPIQEIARMVGFPTLSSYNRNFQKILHLAPSEWVKTQPRIPAGHRILSLDNPDHSSIFQF